MTTPVWQAGTLYAPGALVQPASTPAPQADEVTNGGFESGNTGWTMDAGFSIGQFGDGTHFQGTWSLQWDSTAEGRAINNNATEVVAGQSITATCQVQQGASSSGQAGARAEIIWYDASDDFLSVSSGNLVNSTSNQNWKQSSITAVAPAGAAFARFSVFAFRLSGGAELWVDNCTWNAVVASLPTGLVFRAVQAVAGYSGSTEPTWPLVLGQQVVDNEVTWEAVFASRVVWEATPILVSGPYEPDWPTVPDGTVADGTIKWVAMNARVEQAPRSKIVAIAASKVFAGDGDIIRFSATVNPLDWTSEGDAGYLPFGQQTYGGTPVEALGLYRSNLLAFNSQGYQMWQVDQDPANMAYLDGSPVPCTFRKSGQPVMNDYVFLTPLGIRNIGLAGGSANLQAGHFGDAVDALVRPAIKATIAAGFEPFGLFFPGAGQYWLVFEDQAIVLTMNGGPKDASWSRYVFPETITDWAVIGVNLYLRAGNIVWLLSDDALQDDITPTGVVCDGGNWFQSIGCEEIEPPDILNAGVYTFDSEQDPEQRRIFFNQETQLPATVPFLYEITEDPTSDDVLYFWYRTEQFGAITHEELTDSSGTITVTPSIENYLEWGITTSPDLTIGQMTSGVVKITCEEEGTDFEGYIAWPYLDFGTLGADKNLESIDLAINGECSISLGWSQRDESLATPGYEVSGDTLTGTPIPIPITGPSFQLRLTFAPNQAWEWQAAALNVNL